MKDLLIGLTAIGVVVCIFFLDSYIANYVPTFTRAVVDVIVGMLLVVYGGNFVEWLVKGRKWEHFYYLLS